MAFSVLFVCTANVCRSPMALGLMQARLKRMLSKQSLKEWKVESAGTWAIDGAPPVANTLAVLKARGIELGAHSARTVTKELLSSFNLILTMEHGHKEALQYEFPELADRIFLLSEMAGQQYDIRDPVGEPMDEFERTAREIDAILAQGFERIRALAKDSTGS